MGFEGQANLQDAKPQQNQADGTNQGEDKLTQVIDHRQWIIGGKGGDDEHGDS